MKIFTFMAAILLWLLAPLSVGQSAGQTALGTAPSEFGFEGLALVTLADGAMVASGYIDGRLGSRQPDLLSVITLPTEGSTIRYDLEVTNSVATWPNVLALTRDGRFAIVSESFGQPSEEATTFSEIPVGSLITVVDISNPNNLAVTQEVEAPSNPAALDLHPSGTLVTATLPGEGQIALYPFKDGRLGEPSLHSLAVEDLTDTSVLEFKWHPTGEFAAVTLAGAEHVVFYRYDGEALTLWGEPMRTAPLPGKGEWTPDGKYFIITTITATSDMAQLGYGRNASLFAVFDFDQNEVPDSSPRRADDRSTTYESDDVQHARVSQIPGGIGYVENFAISPDGRWVVGLNMAASWLPHGHPGRTTYSELTLFSFDSDTGSMTPHDVTRLDGVMLPQGISFDAEGQHLVVTSYQHDDQEGGSLSFWRLEEDGTPRLMPVGEELLMPRGVHLVELVE